MDYQYLEPTIALFLECVLLLLFWRDISLGIIAIFIDRMILRDCFQTEFFTTLAGFNIFTVDLFTFNCFGLSLLRLGTLIRNATSSRNSLPYTVLLAVSAILFINLGRGYGIYTTQAYWHAKHYLLFLAIVFYVLSVPADYAKIYRSFRAVAILSAIIVIVAFLKYFGLIYSASAQSSSYYAYRVVDRDAVMSLVFIIPAVMILASNNLIRISLVNVLFVATCIITIIFSNLRIGWLCLATALGFLFLQIRARLVSYLVPILFAAGALTLFSHAYFPNIMAYIFEGVSVSFVEQTSSFEFRQNLDQAYLHYMSPTSFLIGMPAGEYPDRLSFLGAEAIGLHNQYMSFLYNAGVPGLSLFLLLNAFVLVRLRRLAKSESEPARKSVLQVLALGIICYLPFLYVNTFDTLYAAIIGTAISVISASELEGRMPAMQQRADATSSCKIEYT
ncbi:MAG: O-antigen ligase family protein [Syntrophales bacterium]